MQLINQPLASKRWVELFADDIRAFGSARILITGGTGFIGSWLCESIRIANRDLGTKIRFVACDRHLIFQGPFDGVIHGAPIPLNLLLHHAYDWGQVPVLTLSSGAAIHKPLSYLNGYGAMKQSDEIDAGTYGTKVARVYSVLGPNLPAHLAAAQFLAMARGGGPIVVHSGGLSIRSYLWAGDLVAWLWAIFARGKPAVAYEVGGRVPVSIEALARAVGAASGASVHLSGPNIPGDSYLPDLTLARTLGLTETCGLTEAIRRSL